MRIQVPASREQVNLYLTDARFRFFVDSMVPIFLKGVEKVCEEMDAEGTPTEEQLNALRLPPRDVQR